VNGRAVTVRLPRRLAAAANGLCRRRGWSTAELVKAMLEEDAVRPFPAVIVYGDLYSRRQTFRVNPELYARLRIAARGADVAPLIRQLLAAGLKRAGIIQ
jgi:predicted HicB family RNase H-like nuclease